MAIEPKYGSFDGSASRYDDDEAWVLQDDGWVQINQASHGNAVRPLSKEDYDDLFPDLPPLPYQAFQSPA
jgi:hypothetical protein